MALVMFALWQLFWFLCGLALFAFVISIALFHCIVFDAQFRGFLWDEFKAWIRTLRAPRAMP